LEERDKTRYELAEASRARSPDESVKREIVGTASLIRSMFYRSQAYLDSLHQFSCAQHEELEDIWRFRFRLRCIGMDVNTKSPAPP